MKMVVMSSADKICLKMPARAKAVFMGLSVSLSHLSLLIFGQALGSDIWAFGGLSFFVGLGFLALYYFFFLFYFIFLIF